MNNAKKHEKIEWERLEISSRKLEIPREHFMQRWAQSRTEMVWTQQKEKILRRGSKNTQKNYTKKIFTTQVITSVITHLEPDILECEVRWALGSITINKDSGGDRIPVELFQILKDEALKVLHSICQQIWKTQQWPQDWKKSIFIPVPKKDNAKECSNYCTIALISHVSKVMLKFLQARLQ